jgi:hypothetical protein
VPRHELLGERLAALEARGRARRPERGDAPGRERVDEAERERRLGADDHEVDRKRLRERDLRLDVARARAVALRDARDAGIAGRGVHFMKGAGQAPRERVFACAGSDDEDAHGPQSSASRRGQAAGRTVEADDLAALTDGTLCAPERCAGIGDDPRSPTPRARAGAAGTPT